MCLVSFVNALVLGERLGSETVESWVSSLSPTVLLPGNYWRFWRFKFEVVPINEFLTLSWVYTTELLGGAAFMLGAYLDD